MFAAIAAGMLLKVCAAEQGPTKEQAKYVPAVKVGCVDKEPEAFPAAVKVASSGLSGSKHWFTVPP